MKIIKSGASCKRTCRFTCKNCGCIFEAVDNEMTIATNKVIHEPGACIIQNEPYAEAKCPWCGENVDAPFSNVICTDLMRGLPILCVGEE